MADTTKVLADALLELHSFGRFTDDTVESLTEISSYKQEDNEAEVEQSKPKTSPTKK